MRDVHETKNLRHCLMVCSGISSGNTAVSAKRLSYRSVKTVRNNADKHYGYEGKSMNTVVFSLSSSITLKHREHRSNNNEIPLPIVPFDIVLCAF